MKKYTILIIATAIALIMILSSCSDNKKQTKATENNSVSVINTDSIETDAPIAIGGIGHMTYEAEYIMDFYSVTHRFTKLVEDKDAIEKWRQAAIGDDGKTRDRHKQNILNYIQTFDIPKEDFKAANLSIGEEYAVYTDAQIEALYSGDKKLLADEFANPFAINIDGDIYTPEWIVTHNLDDIKAAGITEKMLSDKYGKWVEYWPEDSEPCTKAKALLDEYKLSEPAIGGSELALYEAEYIIDFYGLPGHFINLVEDKEAIENWKQAAIGDDGKTCDRHKQNILNYIQTFDIPKEDFIAANLIIGEEYAVYTDAQIEALYSGDKKLLADEFANPFAINIDGDIYTPEWIVTHNLDDIKAAGITEKMLSDKYGKWVEYWPEDSEPCTKAKALLEEYKLSETE